MKTRTLTACGLAVAAALTVAWATPGLAQQEGGNSLVEGARKLAGVLRRPGRYERMHVRVREAFRDVVAEAAPSTVQVHANGRPVLEDPNATVLLHSGSVAQHGVQR